MGLIVEFPADAAARRFSAASAHAPREGMATVLILPSIRIERHGDDEGGGKSEGAKPGRPRRRRARS
jgi:hypothetical protein